MLTPQHSSLSSASAWPTRPLASHLRVILPRVRFTDITALIGLFRLSYDQRDDGKHSKKLGKPPIYNGKEDECSKCFVMRSYVSLLFTHVPTLLACAEDTATSPDMSATRIRATHRRWRDSGKKHFHVLVMNVKGPALAVTRGTTDMNGALAWRALITRYAPNTAPRVQCLMSAILNVKTFPSVLTDFETAFDERQENILNWESIPEGRFFFNMKKALFLTKHFQWCDPHSRCKTWIPLKR